MRGFGKEAISKSRAESKHCAAFHNLQFVVNMIMAPNSKCLTAATQASDPEDEKNENDSKNEAKTIEDRKGHSKS